jgi:mRNA-degrading endonuclease toxin of MazEF toxin-antitoxin module
MTKPSRGQIWFVDLNPIRGHEQAGKRPCLVISVTDIIREFLRSLIEQKPS